MCKARQYGDTMQCGQCGLQWDLDDQDPPSCRGPRHVSALRIHYDKEEKRHLEKLTAQRKAANLKALDELRKMFD